MPELLDYLERRIQAPSRLLPSSSVAARVSRIFVVRRLKKVELRSFGRRQLASRALSVPIWLGTFIGRFGGAGGCTKLFAFSVHLRPTL